ncbi:Desumoylating isopeptidase 2 [Clonorchis sinensis]|uniref:Desumoylating isopeptidase 2 n=1 Tax=Clonorchis sinensis TaxID=79923 RepID=A0A8T1MS30_CLOSI|nr:Desumoylating isopeptidase 2 [Clonorchis sinensis]
MLIRSGRSRSNAVPEIICPANFGEPVFVNVYYLHWPNGLKTGAYHTGTVVYDQEYGYGGHPFPSSGIFETEPRDTEMFGDGISFKESLYVGTTYMSRYAVQRLLISMSDEYRGDAYHLLNFNCNTFTAQFIQLIPKRLLRLNDFDFGIVASSTTPRFPLSVQMTECSLCQTGQLIPVMVFSACVRAFTPTAATIAVKTKDVCFSRLMNYPVHMLKADISQFLRPSLLALELQDGEFSSDDNTNVEQVDEELGSSTVTSGSNERTTGLQSVQKAEPSSAGVSSPDSVRGHTNANLFEKLQHIITWTNNVGQSFSCSHLSVPSCHATQRKHEGWDTAKLPKPRQGKSKGRGRFRTTDLPVSKFAL